MLIVWFFAYKKLAQFAVQCALPPRRSESPVWATDNKPSCMLHLLGWFIGSRGFSSLERRPEFWVLQYVGLPSPPPPSLTPGALISFQSYHPVEQFCINILLLFNLIVIKGAGRSKANKEAKLMEKKICFILDAGNLGVCGGGR